MVVTMSHAIFCRLCENICKDYKRLFDDTEVYEITVKYFDPMFLNAKHYLTAICLDCWSQVVDFYHFQQTIVQAQITDPQDDPLARVCRLCAIRHKDFVRFVDDSEICETVSKYFSVNFLDMKDHTGICLECWSHIYGFHKFQQSVVQAETKLLKEKKTSYIAVKREIAEFTDQAQQCLQVYNGDKANKEESLQVIIKSKIPDLVDQKFQESSNGNASNADFNSDYVVKEEHAIFSRPELELIDVNSEDQFSSSDEIEMSGFLVKHIDTSTVNKRSINEDSLAAITSAERDNREDNLSMGYESSNDDDNFNPNRSNQTAAERKKTIQKLDDFIAQWRPTLDCVICNRSCSTFTLLQKHFEMHHPTEQCHIFCCQCKFKSHYYIEEHIRFHKDPNVFKCQLCGQRNTTKLNLKRHMEYWHPVTTQQTAAAADTNALVCGECGKPAKTAGALRKHMQRHEAKRKFKCAICDKGFRGRHDLRNHLATHKQNACPHCPMTFKYLSKLRTHLAKDHGN